VVLGVRGAVVQVEDRKVKKAPAVLQQTVQDWVLRVLKVIPEDRHKIHQVLL
jgi:hypothetical protein